MLSEFEKKVAGFIEANQLLGSGDGILLAVSGGADSTALLYTMQALRAEKVLTAELLCAHMNHQLRGAEADSDEDFVTAQADSLELPVATKRVDVRGFARANRLSTETAGRKLRIETLLEIAKANNCARIATGHQKNDNAETVLYRLLRGTGFPGLGGIWPARAFDEEIKFVRPLLCVTRDEIVEYLQERNLKWRTDRTNADCTYRRNYIRHRLLPALQQQCNGSVAERLSELARSARTFHALVCSRADKAWQKPANSAADKVVLSLKSLLPEHPAVKVELVRRCLTTVGSGERDLTHQHYERILQLAEQIAGGRKIELPDGFVVRREYENLLFTRSEESSRCNVQISQSASLEVPGQTRFGNRLITATILESRHSNANGFRMDSCLRRNDTGRQNKFVEKFDYDKVILPLVARFREAGDKFWPLGLAGAKKVGKFLTTAHVPQHIRSKALIVADSEKIIWVWPIRISEQAKITDETKKILELRITGPKLGR